MQNQSFSQLVLQIDEKIKTLHQIIGVDSVKKEIESLDLKIKDDAIWNDHEKLSSISKQKSSLEKKISDIVSLSSNFQAIKELSSFASEEEISTFSIELIDIEKQIDDILLLQNFSQECDQCGAFLELNSGAGGTESQDWVEMMVRMYSMWAEQNGFSCEIIDSLNGEEAGFKSATLKVTGEFAYGWLKGENGVHRLVRISPFNANAKRQTSFASVFTYPIVDDNISIEIIDSDLKIDTYRASGAGGQHVNKTESAVRITHNPSGIVVACQTQRSQVQNKSEAIKMLKSKLFEAEMKKRNAETDKINAQKSDINFGSQIRNYVLHPYQMVKDTRSGWETQNAQGFLSGKMKDCMESVIKQRIIDQKSSNDK